MDFDTLSEKYDTSRIIDKYHEFLTRFSEAYQIGRNFDVSPEFRGAYHVIGVGMGGSGMGFRLVDALMKKSGNVSFEVISGYNLPSYVDSKTAVLINSFSGNTEETLNVGHQALEAGCPIICISTGGELEAWARDNMLPLITYQYHTVSRVALPYSFGLALGLVDNAGYLKVSDNIEDVVSDARRVWPQARVVAGAQQLALQLKDKAAYIIGSDVLSPVAVIWKGLLNENAKTVAFNGEMPEMCHNTLLGLQLPIEVMAKMTVVNLQSKFDNGQNTKRYNVVSEMLSKSGASITDVKVADVGSELGAILVHLSLAEYASYYLALLNEKDPVDTVLVEELKKQL